VKIADADGLLRAVAEGDEARRLLARLCEQCREERALPEARSIRELARAPLERQVEYARLYFRKKKALRPKEVEILLAVSETVIAELAVALGVDEGDLRSAVKRGKPQIEPQVARALPTAPPLEGYTFLRSFWLGAVALVGETPEQDEETLRVSVKPGAWHAYSADECEAPFDDGGGVLLRHSDLPPGTRAASAKLDLGGVNLEGGTISVLDAAALTDPEFGLDEVERTLHILKVEERADCHFGWRRRRDGNKVLEPIPIKVGNNVCHDSGVLIRCGAIIARLLRLFEMTSRDELCAVTEVEQNLGSLAAVDECHRDEEIIPPTGFDESNPLSADPGDGIPSRDHPLDVTLESNVGVVDGPVWVAKVRSVWESPTRGCPVGC
jgi:hypothetical protein